MSRKNRFRQQRNQNIKIVVILLFFFIIIFSGIFAVEYNRCRVFYGEGYFQIFSVQDNGQDIYCINILENKININLRYVKRDYKKLTNFLQKIQY